MNKYYRYTQQKTRKAVADRGNGQRQKAFEDTQRQKGALISDRKKTKGIGGSSIQ